MILALAPFMVAQESTYSNQASDTTNKAAQSDNNGGNATSTPSGTKVVGHDTDTIVAPKKNHVKIDSDTIKSAQKALNDRGYSAGSVDGVNGPQTRAAISKFQSDQGLTQTGKLDADTLTKLNVGGTKVLSTAPGDVARGGKAFGHDIKEGHPVDASKGLAQGTVSGAKSVGKGSESLAKEGVSKVGSGLSHVGDKIDNTVSGDKKKSDDNPNENQTDNSNQNPQ